MPLSECATTAGTLTDAQRAEIADVITRAHVEITGAPFEFVRVVVPTTPAGRTFTGGEAAAPILPAATPEAEQEWVTNLRTVEADAAVGA